MPGAKHRWFACVLRMILKTWCTFESGNVDTMYSAVTQPSQFVCSIVFMLWSAKTCMTCNSSHLHLVHCIKDYFTLSVCLSLSLTVCWRSWTRCQMWIQVASLCNPTAQCIMLNIICACPCIWHNDFATWQMLKYVTKWLLELQGCWWW